MSWRLANSLDTLRRQLNTAYPNRSKASDGTIGDTAHSASASDHNPNAAGVVTAFDITHDPANGLDAHKLAEVLIKHRNPNLKYVISNSRIATYDTEWVWRPYGGSNPHSKHIHVSVGRGSDGKSVAPYDGTEPWTITEGGDMPIERKHEEVASELATGAKPGKDYSYQFVGSNDWFGMLAFWNAQSDAPGGLRDKLRRPSVPSKVTQLKPGLYEVK